MDWITGLTTVVGMELVARKHWAGWLVCLLNQGFWAYLIYDRKVWGLIPLTCILTWRYASFLLRWRTEANVQAQVEDRCPAISPR